MPIGDVPQSFVVKQQGTEFAVASVGPGRATDQAPAGDEEIATVALDWSRMSLKRP